jgi:hypothetical protein
MTARRVARSIVAGAVIAAVGACAGHHTYGVSLPDRTIWGAAQYLEDEGFHDVAALPGEQLSMERQHGDSVDRVHFIRGGRAPDMAGFTMPGSGGAAYLPGGAGVAQGVSSGGYMTGLSGGGVSGNLVFEIMSYRVDRKGKRSAIEPSDVLFKQADSVITLVTGVPSSRRK